MLWWHRTLAESDVFLCHGCYVRNRKQDFARAMPEGCEDVKTFKEFVARKKQLCGSDEGKYFSKSESVRKRESIRNWCCREA